MALFTPSRLVLARQRRGLTKKALAAKSGVSLRSLTDYEAEKQEPSALLLARLAVALDFPVEFFSRPPISAPPLEGSSFRALKRMAATQRDKARSAGGLAQEMAQWIATQFDLPEPSIPRYRGVEAEEAAQEVRDEWGLGIRPIRNMVHLLEAHGVRVFSLAEESRDVDAFSAWLDEVPYVFLNTFTSSERSRMDAAHELGHLVLHAGHERVQGREAEQDANDFGAAFLMPRLGVETEAPRSGRMRDLIRAKRRWGVSVGNLAYRMHKLGLLTDWQARSIFMEINAKGYRMNEPNGMAREASQVLGKVFHGLREEGMSQAEVARTLAISLSDLHDLVFGLVLTPMDGGGDSHTSERPALRVVEN